jgi:hypothetical protein
MSDSDIMMLSIFFNIILLFNNWLMHKRYEALHILFAKSFRLAEAIADGKATVSRDSKGLIRIKDLRDEKDKSSTSAV